MGEPFLRRFSNCDFEASLSVKAKGFSTTIASAAGTRIEQVQSRRNGADQATRSRSAIECDDVQRGVRDRRRCGARRCRAGVDGSIEPVGDRDRSCAVAGGEFRGRQRRRPLLRNVAPFRPSGRAERESEAIYVVSRPLSLRYVPLTAQARACISIGRSGAAPSRRLRRRSPSSTWRSLGSVVT